MFRSRTSGNGPVEDKPAANAPTIGARPPPRQVDSRKQNASETPISTPAPRRRAAPAKRRGVIHVPRRSDPARNPTPSG